MVFGAVSPRPGSTVRPFPIHHSGTAVPKLGGGDVSWAIHKVSRGRVCLFIKIFFILTQNLYPSGSSPAECRVPCPSGCDSLKFYCQDRVFLVRLLKRYLPNKVLSSSCSDLAARLLGGHWKKPFSLQGLLLPQSCECPARQASLGCLLSGPFICLQVLVFLFPEPTLPVLCHPLDSQAF